MDLNNKDEFSKLINLSLLSSFYNQLKNVFVSMNDYNAFYTNITETTQSNSQNINLINTNLNTNYYTKSDIDNQFNTLNQGIMTSYYSKSDIDSKINVINNNLNTISQNLNNNYYNKQYIDNNFLSLNGGVINGSLEVTEEIIGNLNGTASNAVIANNALSSNNSLTTDKLKNKLIFNGYQNNEFDGSEEITINIPTQTSTPYSLIIQLNNGTIENNNKFTFNGSENKIINITPESIGSISNDELLNYLPLTGGTLTGNLTAPSFIGNLNGNANTASKLNNLLSFTGFSNQVYDGSQEVTIEIPTLLSQLQNDENFATINYVDSKISIVYKFKGSVEDYSDLPTDNEIGDVWDIKNANPTHNINAGDNVVWDGQSWDNLGGFVDLTNYYTKTEISQQLQNYLLLTGGTLSGNLTAPLFIGNLNGNATTSTNSSTTDKLKNSIIFSGGFVGEFDGSEPLNVQIPISGQTEGTLIIQLNNGTTENTNKFTFNGSIDKSVNITPNLIGAPTLSDLNNYLLLSGGILTGNLTAPEFIGNLTGNSSTSSIANKLSNKITFTGGFTGEFDGSQTLNVEIPTSGSTDGTLTIQLNGGTTEGLNKITFNGGVDKLLNITANSIGAITENELSNYLPLSGGILTSSLTATSFIGNLNGTATNVSNSLIFTGYQSKTYNGSSQISIEIPTLLSQLTNDTNFATISYVDSKVSSVYKFKGSVNNYSDLPTTGNEIGDVWDIKNADPSNNIQAGDNVVWTGTYWDNLGGITDLSDYYNKSEIDNKLTTINQSIVNINNNLISNYYTKTDVDTKLNNYLTLSGGTVIGNITATKFIGNLEGNADTSTIATKVNNKLTFTGAINATYDGSSPLTINIPTSLQGDYLPLSGGTLTGNLNSCSIIPTLNSSYNIGSSLYKYNNIYANTFNGNATSSNIANKVSNTLTFTGASTETYDGSSPVTINIPTFQQTDGILTIQFNNGNTEGTNKFTFNGSTNKTVNITPDSIGAVTTNTLNDYLLLSGGTIDGDLYVTNSITANTFIGNLTGNSSTSDKVNNTLTFTGYANKTYNGSNDVTVNIPNKTSQLANDSGFLTSSAIGEAMSNYTLSRIFPVGSIFTSVNNVNPSSFIGGTWERFGQGKVLVGVDENDSDFNIVQKTGGSKTVALTTAQMPAHNHGSKSLKGTLEYVHASYPLINASGIVSKSQLSQLDNYTGTNANARNRGQWNIDASHTHNTEGAGQAHDNLQPYITVYMWLRTA